MYRNCMAAWPCWSTREMLSVLWAALPLCNWAVCVHCDGLYGTGGWLLTTILATIYSRQQSVQGNVHSQALPLLLFFNSSSSLITPSSPLNPNSWVSYFNIQIKRFELFALSRLPDTCIHLSLQFRSLSGNPSLSVSRPHLKPFPCYSIY